MKEQIRFAVAIDRGNSYAKATLLEEGRPIARVRSSRLTPEELHRLCAGKKINAAIVSTVGCYESDLKRFVAETLSTPVLELTSLTPLPLIPDYSSPQTLGLDRIAATIGAANLFPGQALLVADSGTALTLDAVDSTGRFRGGDIAPGIKLRLRSLHEYTSRLPEVEKLGPVPEFGSDTETAMRCGAIRGIAAEISDAMRRAQRRFGAKLVVLTGGDAELVAPFVRESISEEDQLTIEPDLVAIGLYYILLHNQHTL